MPISRSLLLKGLAGAGAVTLGGLGIGYRENIGNFFSGKGRAEKVREGGGREIINEKLKSLGLEGDCLLEEGANTSSFSRECSMDEGKLKKINFSNRGKEELKISEQIPENLKLKIDGTEGDISFSFTGVSASSSVTIFGDKSKGKIVINDKEQKFRDVNGQLTKGTPSGALRKLNEQLGKVNAPIECRFDESDTEESIECPIDQKAFKTLEFSNKEIKKDLKVVGSLQSGLKLKVEKDSENVMSFSFPNQSTELKIFGRKDKGKIVLKTGTKFKVKDGKLTKENRDSEIEKFNEQLRTVNAPIECRFDEAEREDSVDCVVSKDQFMELGFPGKTSTKIEVKNWPSSGTVKLKAEKNSASPATLSLSFTGLNNGSNPTTIYREGGKTIIKSDTKFTVVNSQLTKQSGTVDADRKKFNNQLLAVNAPLECRFDVMETDETVECEVSKEQLATMAFAGGEFSRLTYSAGSSNFSGMKMALKISKEKDDSETPKDISILLLTFKEHNKTVKLMNGKVEAVSFVKGTNPEFGIYNVADVHEDYGGSELLVLDKEWRPYAVGELLGLECTDERGHSKGECTFVGETKKIKVGKDTESDPVELTVTNPTTNKFELHEDEEGYNQGYKFVFKGTKVPESGNSGVCLEPNSNYEFKWKLQDDKTRVGYLVKKEGS